MTLGQTITEARKARGMKQDALAKAIGISAPTLSTIENDNLKGGPDPQTVIRIADALGCEQILFKYLEDNPVYRAIIPKIFPDLNNIRRDPAIIFTRVAKEAKEAEQAAQTLAEIFSNADPHRVPGFDDTFKAMMQQLVDVKRAVEILETQLVASHILNQEGLRVIYAAQQKKCEEHGHHVPAEDLRTGTEG